MADSPPVGAQDQINPIFRRAPPAAELPGVGVSPDLRIAAQSERAAALVTALGHTKLMLLALVR